MPAYLEGMKTILQNFGESIKNKIIFFPKGLVLLFLPLAACATPLSEIAQDFKDVKPTRIAVLPVQNETADMDAPLVFRILARAELADKGYALVEPAQIDEALREKGVEEAGQIDSLTPQEIGECVEADTLLYIDVSSYGRQAAVHLKMEGNFTLVDSRIGRKLWFSELGISDDIVLEGGMAVLMGELFGGKDKEKSRQKAMETYLAVRQARITQAVSRFQAHPIRREVFEIITIDMDKIYLLEIFFSRNFNKLPRRGGW
jgi:hypothetical protein